MNKASYVSEIYSAIQGEGPLVGVRQLFVRFSACDLRCVWCDTPESLIRSDFCEVEQLSGSREFTKIKNPIEPLKLIELLSNLNPAIHHSISFTGGEPLLQVDAILSLIPLIKNKFSLPVYLETGGHRVNELRKVINFIDYLSMDFKLPSSAKTPFLWDSHNEFLKISLSSKNLKNIWVKIVVTNHTSFDELIKSVKIIKSMHSNKVIEVILQPVTEINGSKPPGESEMLNLQSRLLEYYKHVRVLPQVHKLMNQK